MEIKVDDLWQYGGIDIQVGDKLVNEYLPKGSYTFVGREIDSCYRLFSNGIFYLLEEWEDDDIVTTYTISSTKRVDNLVEATTALCISLIQDGWREDSDHLNLTPHLNELRGYKALQTLLKGND